MLHTNSLIHLLFVSDVQSPEGISAKLVMLRHVQTWHRHSSGIHVCRHWLKSIWEAYPNPSHLHMLREKGWTESSPNHQPAPIHHPLPFPPTLNTNSHLTFFIWTSCIHSKSFQTCISCVFSETYAETWITVRLLPSLFLLCHQALGFTSCGVRPENT